MSENLSLRETPVTISALSTAEGSYVDWAAILAGSVFALAISFLLISFGTSVGLSLSSPYQGKGASGAWIAIAVGIWFAWVMVTGFGAGGYLCGRLRRRAGDATAGEVEVRDGAHGLLVWATGALVSMVLAAAGAGGLVSAGTSAVGSAVGAVSDVAASTVSSDYFAHLMLRSTVKAPETGAMGADTPTADQFPEQQLSRQAPSNTAGIDLGVQQQVASIIARSVASGEMAERDRSYLAQLVAANSDLDAAAARTRVDEINTEIDNARVAALAAVERARVTGVVFGFIAAATLLIGAAAAFFAAAAGGRHRDNGLGFNVFVSRR